VIRVRRRPWLSRRPTGIAEMVQNLGLEVPVAQLAEQLERTLEASGGATPA
jgi:hypothetical protein